MDWHGEYPEAFQAMVMAIQNANIDYPQAKGGGERDQIYLSTEDATHYAYAATGALYKLGYKLTKVDRDA